MGILEAQMFNEKVSLRGAVHLFRLSSHAAAFTRHHVH